MESPAALAANSTRAASASQNANTASGFGAAASAPDSHFTIRGQSSYRFSLTSFRHTSTLTSPPRQPSRNPANLSRSMCIQSFEKNAAWRKRRSAKCSAASRPIAPWSPMTRGSRTSGWQMERSTTGISLAYSFRT